MVFLTLANITFEIGFWGVKKMYGVGYSLIWGNVPTETEKLLEKQNITIELLHKDLELMNEKIGNLEKTK